MPAIIKTVDMSVLALKAGEVLFRENEPSQGFFILKKGSVDVYKSYGKADQVHLATIQAGCVVGELSAIDGLQRSATAVVKEDLEVVLIGKEILAYQLKQCPGWFRTVITDLVERLRRADEMLLRQGVTKAHSVSSLKETDSG